MVDPINFTKFDRSERELQEAILFCVLVTGKNAITTAKALDRLLNTKLMPFDFLGRFSEPRLRVMLKTAGIGCYNNKAKSIYELVHAGFNLRTCSVDDLENIHGIGRKTSRYFVLHTRPNVNLAVLDVHILRHLAECGYKVPPTTPSSKSKYEELEKIFLELAKKAGKSPCDYDLELWNKRRAS
jgi:thermostable 8-oxoguanine DNA glycosylase